MLIVQFSLTCCGSAMITISWNNEIAQKKRRRRRGRENYAKISIPMQDQCSRTLAQFPQYALFSCQKARSNRSNVERISSSFVPESSNRFQTNDRVSRRKGYLDSIMGRGMDTSTDETGWCCYWCWYSFSPERSKGGFSVQRAQRERERESFACPLA